MTLDEMVNDFCKRAKTIYTPEQIIQYGKKNIPYFDEDGFFILSMSDCSEMNIDFFYIVPGRPRQVLKRYIDMIFDLVQAKGCRYVHSMAVRDKGFDRLFAKRFPMMKPIGTFYECDMEVTHYVKDNDN